MTHPPHTDSHRPDDSTSEEPGSLAHDDVPTGSSCDAGPAPASDDRRPAGSDAPTGELADPERPDEPSEEADPGGDGTAVSARDDARPESRARKLAPWVVAAVGAAAYIAYSAIQWRNFAVPSWDQGIFTELAKQYANLEPPVVDIKGPGFNLLGDHFHPILVLLAPFYRLFPSGLTLLVVQDLLFAVSVVPIMRLAFSRLGGRSGVALGVAYLASWGLWSAVASQFHEIAFAVPLLAYGLCAWIESEGRSRSAVVAMGLLVFVKEDLGLTVAAFGAVVVWREWGRATREGSFALRVRSWESLRAAFASRVSRTGAKLALWGIAWTVLAIVVILPAINPGGAWDYTERLSDTETVSSNVFVRFFLPATKLLTLGLLVLAAGIVGMASPYAWLMLPTLVWRFLGNVEFYWGWEWHYSAILVPIAMVALIDSSSRWGNTRGLATAAVAVSLCSNATMAWKTSISHFVDGHPHAVSSSERRAAEGAIEALGTGHRVVGSVRMLAYLVPGNTVFWEGTTKGATVNAVVMDPGSSAANSWVSADRWANDFFGGQWSLIYFEDWYQVAVRVG